MARTAFIATGAVVECRPRSRALVAAPDRRAVHIRVVVPRCAPASGGELCGAPRDPTVGSPPLSSSSHRRHRRHGGLRARAPGLRVGDEPGEGAPGTCPPSPARPGTDRAPRAAPAPRELCQEERATARDTDQRPRAARPGHRQDGHERGRRPRHRRRADVLHPPRGATHDPRRSQLDPARALRHRLQDPGRRRAGRGRLHARKFRHLANRRDRHLRDSHVTGVPYAGGSRSGSGSSTACRS